MNGRQDNLPAKITYQFVTGSNLAGIGLAACKDTRERYFSHDVSKEAVKAVRPYRDALTSGNQINLLPNASMCHWVLATQLLVTGCQNDGS